MLCAIQYFVQCDLFNLFISHAICLSTFFAAYAKCNLLYLAYCYLLLVALYCHLIFSSSSSFFCFYSSFGMQRLIVGWCPFHHCIWNGYLILSFRFICACSCDLFLLFRCALVLLLLFTECFLYFMHLLLIFIRFIWRYLLF